jgi:aminoglycoside N3'-acetyltransferase
LIGTRGGDATTMSTHHPIRALVADLERLGVCAGDTIMVHASLKAIGPTEGRVAGLIEALDRAVGQRGTLLMVLGARNEHAWVNHEPEDARAALLERAEPFDALVTPADADVGTLAELFRQHPGTRVSDHPEGRFAARGARAEALVADPPWHDYYGPGSALQRLVDLDGKVLRMGANTDTVTLLHHAEYLADLPYKRRARRHRLIRTTTGTEVSVVDCLDDEFGIVDLDGDDYFTRTLRAYLATERARRGTVGSASSELLEARDLVPFGVRWMEEHLVEASSSTAR